MTVVSLVTAHANIWLPMVMGVVVALVIGLLLIRATTLIGLLIRSDGAILLKASMG